MTIKDTSINTLGKLELASLMKDVSNDVASVIAKTYGPFGANTLIQSADTVYGTKDGWTVAQHLNYPNNSVKNALKKLITDCMQSVLLRVGDGTSTVDLLANAIYNHIYDRFINHERAIYHVKELETALNKLVRLISAEIAKSGKLITAETQRDVIYKIASISTNWDTEMATFIANIYSETNNPIIKFENSGSDISRVEYITGYEVKGQLLLKDLYYTDRENGKCTIKNPTVLIFNYSIGMDMFDVLYLMAQSLKVTDQKSLVVIAPDFMPEFINTLKTMNMTLRRNQGELISLIPFKYYNHLPIDKDCMDDLCYLLNTESASRDNTNMADMFNDLKDALKQKTYIDKQEHPDEEEKKLIYENASRCLDAGKEYLKAASGTCNSITLTDKYLIAEGFPNANTEILKQREEDLQHEIDVKTKECAALSMITEGIRLKRVRLGKLKLKMGVIYIGGFGDAHLKERRDALDDATKACEAVYESGYTVGGEIAPILAIDRIMHRNDAKLSGLELELLNMIQMGYREVLTTMYKNRYGSSDGKIKKLISHAIETGKPHNLMTETLDENIITPVAGDVEILKGSMNLVIVMIGANQFVFQDIHSFEDLERVTATEMSSHCSVEDHAKILSAAGQYS